MVDWFSKPVIATAAVTAGLLSFGSGFLISRAVYKKDTATTTSTTTSTTTTPSKSVRGSTSAQVAVTAHNAPAAPTAPATSTTSTTNAPAKYHVVSMMGPKQPEFSWSWNDKDMNNQVPDVLHQNVTEHHPYTFEIRITRENLIKLQEAPSDAKLDVIDLIEVWCPNTMRPLPSPLIRYTGCFQKDIYKKKLAEHLTVEKAKTLFTDKNGKAPLGLLKESKKIADNNDLASFAQFACPQLAPRPVTPVKVESYNPFDKAKGYRCNIERDNPNAIAPHRVALEDTTFDTNPGREGFKDYPERSIKSSDTNVSWHEEKAGYTPNYYMSDWLITTAAWSHVFFPMTDADTGKPMASADPYTGMVDTVPGIDGTLRLIERAPIPLHYENGFPVNPCGRTGMSGRGLLGAWGPNSASDPVVTRSVRNDKGEFEVQVLLVSRPDNVAGETRQGKPVKVLAIPGGIADLIAYDNIKKSESSAGTSNRELAEETGMVLDFISHPSITIIYKGYSDDRRNTDNAWMQTVVMWKHLAYMPLYADENVKAINQHRHVVKYLNKVIMDLQKIGDEKKLNAYLGETLPASVNVLDLDAKEIKDFYTPCQVLDSEPTSCAAKIQKFTGMVITMDNKPKNKVQADSLGLLRKYAGLQLTELRRINGFNQAFDLMKQATEERKKERQKELDEEKQKFEAEITAKLTPEQKKEKIASKKYVNEYDDSDAAVAMEVLLDALAYIMKKDDFAADDSAEITGQAWLSIDKQLKKEPKFFFAMHAYFIRRLAQLVEQEKAQKKDEFHEVPAPKSMSTETQTEETITGQ